MTRAWWETELPTEKSSADAQGLLHRWWLREALVGTLRDGGPPLRSFEAEGQFDGDVDQLIDIVVRMGGRVVSNETKFDPSSRRRKQERGGFDAVWDSCVLRVSMERDDWSTISINTTDPELGQGIVDAFTPVLKKRGKKREVYVLIKDEDGYNMSSLGAHGLRLERGNYSPGVLEGYDHVLSDFQEKSPCGRVVVIDGPPGTGKTHLIRGMIQESEDTTFVLLPPTMIEGISGPSVVQALVGWRRSSSGPIVFVLEDADAVLSSRKFDNINAVNEILNLGDGILGAALDIRIVATTNTPKIDLDKAIMREGRLCRHVEVDRLDAETARRVAARIGLDDTDVGPATLAELYGRRDPARKAADPAKKRTGF